MYKNENRIAEEVYDTLIGNLVSEYALDWVEEIFIPGHPCHESYCRMLTAYHRACARLGNGEEDADLEEMVDSLLAHGRILALEMFRYGCIYRDKSNGNT